MAFVFISVSSEQLRIASAIANALRKAKHDFWLYSVSAKPGADHTTQAMEAIDRCDAFVIIVSKTAVNAPWVERELHHAVEQGKLIVPVYCGVSHEYLRIHHRTWAYNVGPAIAQEWNTSKEELQNVRTVLDAVESELSKSLSRGASFGGMGVYIALSSPTDEDLVQQLADWLTNKGVEVWTDFWEEFCKTGAKLYPESWRRHVLIVGANHKSGGVAKLSYLGSHDTQIAKRLEKAPPSIAMLLSSERRRPGGIPSYLPKPAILNAKGKEEVEALLLAVEHYLRGKQTQSAATPPPLPLISETSGGNFELLRERVDNLVSVAKGLREVEKKIGIGRSNAERIISELSRSTVKIGLVGEFSCGKTTFLNSMIGRNSLPSTANPTTKVVVTVHNCGYEQEQVVMRVAGGADIETVARNLRKRITSTPIEEDGRRLAVRAPLAELEKSIADFIMSDSLAQQLEQVEVHAELEGIASDVTFVDTPGLNSPERWHAERTKAFLKEMDVVLYFLVNGSDTEIRFLSSLADHCEQHLHKVFFVAPQAAEQEEPAKGERLTHLRELVGQRSDYESQIFEISALAHLLLRSGAPQETLTRTQKFILDGLSGSGTKDKLASAGVVPLLSALEGFVLDEWGETRFRSGRRELWALVDQTMTQLQLSHSALMRRKADVEKRAEKALTHLIDATKQLKTVLSVLTKELGELEELVDVDELRSGLEEAGRTKKTKTSEFHRVIDEWVLSRQDAISSVVESELQDSLSQVSELGRGLANEVRKEFGLPELRADRGGADFGRVLEIREVPFIGGFASDDEGYANTIMGATVAAGTIGMFLGPVGALAAALGAGVFAAMASTLPSRISVGTQTNFHRLQSEIDKACTACGGELLSYAAECRTWAFGIISFESGRIIADMREHLEKIKSEAQAERTIRLQKVRKNCLVMGEVRQIAGKLRALRTSHRKRT